MKFHPEGGLDRIPVLLLLVLSTDLYPAWRIRLQFDRSDWLDGSESGMMDQNQAWWIRIGLDGSDSGWMDEILAWRIRLHFDGSDSSLTDQTLAWRIRLWLDGSDSGLTDQTLAWRIRLRLDRSDSGLADKSMAWRIRLWLEGSDSGLTGQYLVWPDFGSLSNVGKNAIKFRNFDFSLKYLLCPFGQSTIL